MTELWKWLERWDTILS